MRDIHQRLRKLQAGQELVAGSGDRADLKLAAEEVESEHARFVRRGDTLHVQDLDSRAGTFVNQDEVRGLMPLHSGDRVRLGQFEFTIDGEAGRSALREASSMDLTLKNACKAVAVREAGKREQKTILDDVSLHVRRGEFVGILGASGSGKSTLIKVLAGLSGLTQGAVLRNGQRVEPQELQNDRRIAYLPQDVVIHEALTPRAALGYIARLKGLGENDEDRDRMVLDALRRVGVEGRNDVPIERLSGGQRKRVALAAELLGDPQVILPDEATSGLDPATEEEMMRLFRSLADEGRTVICITHFPGRLTMCDRLLYLIGGKAAFYGTPSELTQFFGTETIEDVYVRQNDRSADEWRAAFLQSPIGLAAASEVPTAPDVPTTEERLDNGEGAPRLGQQTRQLMQRYFELQRKDWQYLLLLFGQAPVIALMIAVTFGAIGVNFAELHAAKTKEVIFVLVLAVLWCSGTASVREIVKEETILRHETRFGVRLRPYLWSKLLLLGAFTLIQTYVLLLIVRHFTGLTGLFEAQFLVLAFTAIVGVVLGLLVSSIAGTSERAMTVLPVLLIAQAIFSGGLARLEGMVKVFAQVLIPAYWSLDGIRATFGSALRNATYPGAPGHFQPPILGPGGPLLWDVLALILQAGALAGVTYAVLHVKLHGTLPRLSERTGKGKLFRQQPSSAGVGERASSTRGPIV